MRERAPIRISLGSIIRSISTSARSKAATGLPRFRPGARSIAASPSSPAARHGKPQPRSRSASPISRAAIHTSPIHRLASPSMASWSKASCSIRAPKQSACSRKRIAKRSGSPLDARVATAYLDARVYALYDGVPALNYGCTAENYHACDERVNLESLAQDHTSHGALHR